MPLRDSCRGLNLVLVNYIEKLARSIHREVHGDRPLEPDEDVLYLIYAVLALSLGTRVTKRDVHDAWAAWMSSRDGTHKSLKPFEELEPAVQAEDEPYVQAIKRIARQLNRTGAASA